MIAYVQYFFVFDFVYFPLPEGRSSEVFRL